MAFRWDRKSQYGTIATTDYPGLLTYQDVKVKAKNLEDGGAFVPSMIVSKVHALPGQYFMLDTTTTPGVTPNLDYWDVSF